MSMQLSVSLRLSWMMQHVQHHLLIPGLCHILVKQGAVWLQYRTSPLIFNFLLVYVTVYHYLNPIPCDSLKLRQPSPRAGELHSRGWQGLCPAHSLPLCALRVLLVSPWGLWTWMGQEGSTTCEEVVRRDDFVVWREACPSGAMYLSQKGIPAPEFKYVLYKPQDFTAYENDCHFLLFFYLFLTGKIANLLTSSVSTTGFVKGRVCRHAVNRIRAQTFTSLVSCPWESCSELWNLWQPWLLQSRSNEH